MLFELGMLEMEKAMELGHNFRHGRWRSIWEGLFDIQREGNGFIRSEYSHFQELSGLEPIYLKVSLALLDFGGLPRTQLYSQSPLHSHHSQAGYEQQCVPFKGCTERVTQTQRHEAGGR